MNYQETINYLFNSAPLFQNIGKNAYKAGLDNTYKLDEHFDYPHKKFKTIHVAGTNGKGSCSHTLAAILQSAGYKTGLYTSPHLIDFRERIKVDGQPVPESFVVNFIAQHKDFFEPLHPSFFELTTAMAFHYFETQKVDVAVIEVGLGGRMDCTNIIQPDLSVITNISFDHVQFLGDTLAKIAGEKAGIIKPGVPAVIGETTHETKTVFQHKAEEVGAPILFAEEEQLLRSYTRNADGSYLYDTQYYPNLTGELSGLCQEKNTRTILTAIEVLKKEGYQLTETSVRNGFSNVCQLTGLMGRWQKLKESPLIICDTGHNTGGIHYIAQQLKNTPYKTLRIVCGMVNDKDINGVLDMLPKDAVYYFTQASVKRALEANEVMILGEKHQLHGKAFATVKMATEQALKEANSEDMIFVGGSSFIVADLLTAIQNGALHL